MKFIETMCPCGYKSNRNVDSVIPCPGAVFEKHGPFTEVKGFIDEPVRRVQFCEYRAYGGPTAMDCSKFTEKEYLRLTDVYWYCGASTDKKKVVLL